MSESPYPLNPDGPLCPLLADGELLYKIYDESGSRPGIKKFVKRHRWPGKPALSYSVGPETMKKILLGLHDSPEGRQRIDRVTGKSDSPLVLHQVIWNWVAARDPDLIKAVDKHGHTQGDRVYMSPEELEKLLQEHFADGDIEEEAQRRAVLLVLAFAMLQPPDAKPLLAAAVKRFPDFTKSVGLA